VKKHNGRHVKTLPEIEDQLRLMSVFLAVAELRLSKALDDVERKQAENELAGLRRDTMQLKQEKSDFQFFA
jgi:hypothetical protein